MYAHVHDYTTLHLFHESPSLATIWKGTSTIETVWQKVCTLKKITWLVFGCAICLENGHSWLFFRNTLLVQIYLML